MNSTLTKKKNSSLSDDILKLREKNLPKEQRLKIIDKISTTINICILTTRSPEMKDFLKRKYVFTPNHTVSFNETNSQKIADSITSAIVDPKNTKNIRFNFSLKIISIIFFVRFLNRVLYPYIKTNYEIRKNEDFELTFEFIKK